jgi:hypothetical protein
VLGHTTRRCDGAAKECFTYVSSTSHVVTDVNASIGKQSGCVGGGTQLQAVTDGEQDDVAREAMA